MPSRNAATFLALRHKVLPVWYRLGQAGGGVHLMADHPFLARVLWIGIATLTANSLFVLEILGTRGFADVLTAGAEKSYLSDQEELLTRGYTLRKRVICMAQAFTCWFFVGILTVVAFQYLGAQLLARSTALQGVAGYLATWPSFVRMGVAFLLLDLWSYWRHRLEHAGHEGGFLWRLVHRWHHTPVEMNMWTGMVVHPIEAILVFALPSVIFGALGFLSWEMLFLFTLFLTVTMPQHMNSGWTSGVFGLFITGPEVHTRHHSLQYAERNTNFADCFPIWDRLFGTYVKSPPTVFPGRSGLTKEARRGPSRARSRGETGGPSDGTCRPGRRRRRAPGAAGRPCCSRCPCPGARRP